jgi:hypothetical protein
VGRGRGGKFASTWVLSGQRHAPSGFRYDSGMGGFIWRPEGGKLGAPGPQYAVYGKAGYGVGSWSAHRWGVPGQADGFIRLGSNSTQPWHAFDAAVADWKAANAPKRQPPKGWGLRKNPHKKSSRNWQSAAQNYLARLANEEYKGQLRAHLKKRRAKSTFRYSPSAYHRDLVKLLGKNDENGFKVLKMRQGYASSVRSNSVRAASRSYSGRSLSPRKPEWEVWVDGEALYKGDSMTASHKAWKRAKKIVENNAVWLHKGYPKAQIGAY